MSFRAPANSTSRQLNAPNNIAWQLDAPNNIASQLDAPGGIPHLHGLDPPQRVVHSAREQHL
ncbi:hypothetical protein [Mycetocola sp. 2940]|uniref:hypothetical protein n=1 Tax=Mycetocola sp. 2940 TaxID=3156452 RepID=UPI003398ACC8